MLIGCEAYMIMFQDGGGECSPLYCNAYEYGTCNTDIQQHYHEYSCEHKGYFLGCQSTPISIYTCICTIMGTPVSTRIIS